jgi:ubiquitin C-terminal hydrolase
MNFDNNKLKGFNNMGNTCFFNSVLQLMFQCTVLNKLILLNDFNGPLVNLYKELIFEYIDTTDNSFAPKKILLNISNVVMRNDSSQEDADQYMSYIIDNILEEIKSNGNCVIQNKNKTLNDLLGALFDIQIKKSVICQQCNNTSITDDTINKLYLSIDLEQNQTDTEFNLHDLIILYMTEKIGLNSYYICEKCNTYVTALIHKEIYSLPKYLCITIKRYTNSNNKININIDMPMTIDFKLKHNYTYHLRGFIYHTGSTNGGHYVYYGTRQTNWYLFDDSNITQVNLDTIEHVLSKAYIYLYVNK